jgi:hypothetical protein
VTTAQVNEEQLDALSALYRRVAVIGDGLGSENTDAGQVIPTTLKRFSSVRHAHFPLDYELTPLTRPQLEQAFGSVQGVSQLLQSLGSIHLDLGYIAAPGRFDPNAHSRGVFWICIFARGEAQFGRNVLIRFLRVET